MAKTTTTKTAKPKSKKNSTTRAKSSTKTSTSKRSTVKKSKTTVKASSKKQAARTSKKVSTKKATSKTNAPVTSEKASPKSVKSITSKKTVIQSAEKKTAKKSNLASKVEVRPRNSVNAPSKKALKSFQAHRKRVVKRLKAEAKSKSISRKFLAKPPRKGKKYSVDLRIHSPATVGYFSTGGVDAGPALVRLAKVKGLDMIAITDYYNAEYIDRVRENAMDSNVTVIPGFDMHCKIGPCNEVCMMVLLPETCRSADVYNLLNELNVPEYAYGRSDYCLTSEFSSILKTVEKYGGVVIPSRLDKTPYRQQAIPLLVEKYGIHVFDLVHPENTDFFKDRWPDGEFTFFSFSNANALAQVGSRKVKIKLETPGFEGLSGLVARRTGLSESITPEIISTQED